MRRGHSRARGGPRVPGRRGVPSASAVRGHRRRRRDLLATSRPARRSSSTATTTSTGSARPPCSCACCDASAPPSTGSSRRASTTATASPRRPSSGSPRGARACSDRRLRDHGGRGGSASPRAGIDVVVTDHHTPRADGALPDAPIVHPALSGYPCADLCATGVAYKLASALMEAPGASRRGRRDSTSSRSPRSPTSSRCAARTARLVRAGLRALAGTPRPGLRALMRVARVDPSRLDARPPPSGWRRGSTPPGRLHRADAGVELLLTEDEERAERSPPSSTRSTPSAGRWRSAPCSTPRRRSRAPADRPALRSRSGGLAPGCDRDRGVADRRASSPPRGLVALTASAGPGPGAASRLRPARRAAGRRRAPGALRRPPCGRGTEIARPARAFRTAFGAHGRRCSSPRTLSRSSASTPWSRATRSESSSPRSSSASSPAAPATPRRRCSCPPPAAAMPRAMGGAATFASRSTPGGSAPRAVLRQRRAARGRDGPVDATFRLELDEPGRGRAAPGAARGQRPHPAPIEVVGEPDDCGSRQLARARRAARADRRRRTTPCRRTPGSRPPRRGRRRGARRPRRLGRRRARRRAPTRAPARGARPSASAASPCAPTTRCERDPGARALPPPRRPARPARARRGALVVAGDGLGPSRLGRARARLSPRMHRARWSLRAPLAALYRALRAGGRGRRARSARCAATVPPALGGACRPPAARARTSSAWSASTASAPQVAARHAHADSSARRPSAYTRRYEDGLRCLGESTARAA